MTRPNGVGSLLRDAAYLRVWSSGTTVSVARWLELLVVGVFAIETTGSPFLVALLVVMRFLPLAVFGSVVGTLGDRGSPRLFLAGCLLFGTLVSVTVSLLFLWGVAQYWHVALATFAAGLVWSADFPLRRRILGDAAGQARVAAAMSLDSATTNGTRMLGPLLGGVVYQWLGSSGAFAASAVLHAAGAVLILLVPATTSRNMTRPAVLFLSEFLEAFRFVKRNSDVQRILLVTLAFNLWGFPFVSMIPVVGREELALGASAIGALAATEGAGAFVGALTIALFAPPAGFRQIYYFGALTLLMLVFIAGWMSSPIPFGAMLFGIGLAGAGFSTMQSALIYTVAPSGMRGRLFGILVICIGAGLVGFINVGLMAEWFGGSTALRIIAVEGLVAVVLIGVSWRREIHALRPGKSPHHAE